MKRVLMGLFVLGAFAANAVAAERWIHVRVDERGENGERVRVNIPLSLAEKVLPTINADKLHHGKVRVDDHTFKDIDLRALVEAVKTAQDNEYVTVESNRENVRVAKAGGFLLVKVRETPWKSAKAKEGKEATEKQVEHVVDIKIPFAVVNALLSGDKDELDVLAAVRALNEFGDVELVSVNDESSRVRIWVDSRNVAE